MESGDPAAMLVNADRPGVLFEGLPGRVCSAQGYLNFDRKANAATPTRIGDIGLIRVPWHNHV
jgi:hypothetical protein